MKSAKVSTEAKVQQILKKYDALEQKVPDVAIMKPDTKVAEESVLTVTITQGMPVYTFTGPWSGRVVLIILRGLKRAYFHHIANLRREQNAINQQQEVTSNV